MGRNKNRASRAQRCARLAPRGSQVGACTELYAAAFVAPGPKEVLLPTYRLHLQEAKGSWSWEEGRAVGWFYAGTNRKVQIFVPQFLFKQKTTKHDEVVKQKCMESLG